VARVRSVSFRLPDDLLAWLGEESTRRGITRDELLRRLLVDASGGTRTVGAFVVGLAALERRVEGIVEALSAEGLGTGRPRPLLGAAPPAGTAETDDAVIEMDLGRADGVGAGAAIAPVSPLPHDSSEVDDEIVLEDDLLPDSAEGAGATAQGAAKADPRAAPYARRPGQGLPLAPTADLIAERTEDIEVDLGG
jgi:hypothetical protein